MRTFPLLLCALGLVASEAKAEPALQIVKRRNTDQKIVESTLGVRIYSPSRVLKSQDTDEIVSADLETSDSPEKVIAFYERELRAERDVTGMIMTRKGDRTYLVSAIREAGRTLVWIMGQK